MNDQHFELMATLQEQRDQLARLVWMLAPEAYAEQRTLAVDRLVLVHDTIQHAIAYPKAVDLSALKWRITHNVALIERLNAAVVSMPTGDWQAVDAGLVAEGER